MKKKTLSKRLIINSFVIYFQIIQITSAVCTYIIDQLLNGADPDIRAYVDAFDFYIVPIANPDGFAFTHSVV